jgi:predicted trehalose synthase
MIAHTIAFISFILHNDVELFAVLSRVNAPDSNPLVDCILQGGISLELLLIEVAVDQFPNEGEGFHGLSPVDSPTYDDSPCDASTIFPSNFRHLGRRAPHPVSA